MVSNREWSRLGVLSSLYRSWRRYVPGSRLGLFLVLALLVFGISYVASWGTIRLLPSRLGGCDKSHRNRLSS